jgi:hypothetical protein
MKRPNSADIGDLTLEVINLRKTIQKLVDVLDNKNIEDAGMNAVNRYIEFELHNRNSRYDPRR